MFTHMVYEAYDLFVTYLSVCHGESSSTSLTDIGIRPLGCLLGYNELIEFISLLQRKILYLRKNFQAQ